MTGRLHPRNQTQAGISLIEALLALVVMALGMLAVAGVQSNLRANADLSRQRAEAVRLAEEGIEQWRGFSSLDTLPSDIGYGNIVDEAGVVVTPPGSNAIFKRTRAVTVSDSPPMKTLKVTVTWQDRADTTQEVVLNTTIARVAPEVSGSLSVPGNGAPARQPMGRHIAIPPGAIERPDGTSIFTPPQTNPGNVVSYVFNNISGLITQICNNNRCTSSKAQLVSGFLRFALPPQLTGQPSAVDALNPRSNWTQLAALPQLAVAYTTSSAGSGNESCFIGITSIDPNAPLEYFCVLPLYETLNDPAPTWSGRAAFGPSPGLIADTATESSASKLRVCRYFDLQGTGNYAAINGPLSLQNYLFVAAGNGTVAYSCPPGTVAH